MSVSWISDSFLNFRHFLCFFVEAPVEGVIPIYQIKFLVLAYLVQNIADDPFSIDFELLPIFLGVFNARNADIWSYSRFTFSLKKSLNQHISSSRSYLKEGVDFGHNFKNGLGKPLSVGEKDRREDVRFNEVLSVIEVESMFFGVRVAADSFVKDLLQFLLIVGVSVHVFYCWFKWYSSINNCL